LPFFGGGGRNRVKIYIVRNTPDGAQGIGNAWRNSAAFRSLAERTRVRDEGSTRFFPGYKPLAITREQKKEAIFPTDVSWPEETSPATQHNPRCVRFIIAQILRISGRRHRQHYVPIKTTGPSLSPFEIARLRTTFMKRTIKTVIVVGEPQGKT